MAVEAIFAVDNLTTTLENAAQTVDTLVLLVRQILNGGAQALLAPDDATEVKDVLADVGLLAGEFREVVRVARETMRRT